MVPWLRILPVGGVSAAVLILALALTPPREARHGISPEMALARGPLIDRREHPEWPQFLMQAAFRRAGEILKLRDLPDAPTLTAPVALPPPRPPMATEAPPPAPTQDAAVQSAVKALDAAAAPIETPQPSHDVDEVKAAPSAGAPAGTAAANASPVPPEAVEITIAAPLPKPAPDETRIAVLPQERPPVDPDVTGTISAMADETTIPVDIGESSSTELPVVLPPERPPAIRIIQQRARTSHAAPRKKAPQRKRAAVKPAKSAKPAKAAVRHAKTARPANVQPASEVNLFESLFDAGKDPRAAAAKKAGAGRKAGSPSYPSAQSYPVGTQ